MSLEIETCAYCDATSCNRRIRLSEACYCHDCYAELLGMVAMLDEKVSKKDDEIQGLKQELLSTRKNSSPAAENK